MSRRLPVFIHALFRTGSTYLWDKLRRRPDFVCYYEPFHHILATVSSATLASALTKDSRTAGHPSLHKPYLAEYKGLLNDGAPGVRHFQKEFSYDNFCLPDDAPARPQKRYLDFLIRQAGNKIPLFQFNRTALRVGWFKARYPGALNAYIVRDPRDQWQSYHAIRARLGYDGFFLMDLMALGKNREHPLVRPLAAIVPLLNAPASDYSDAEAAYRLLLRCYEDEEAYTIFYYLWLVSLLTNARRADLIIDINALSRAGDYRRRVEAFLRAKWGKGVDFADCRITKYPRHALPARRMTKIEGLVQDLVARTSAGGVPREGMPGLSPRIRDVLLNQENLRLIRPRIDPSASRLDFLLRESGALEEMKEELKRRADGIAEREATIGILREELMILRRSYAFRIGRAALLPWRMIKSASGGLRKTAPPRKPGEPIIKPFPARKAADRKISVRAQLPLDFGRHRSGLKYGIRYLLALHHDRGIWLDAFLERRFCWEPRSPEPFERPWIGFIHVPPGMPAWYFPTQANRAIFRTEAWRQSLPLCRGLFAFSEYHRRHLRAELDIPVDALPLPSEKPSRAWTWEAFESNPDKKVVQVGWWLRNLHGIYRLPATDYGKVFLDAGHPHIPRIMKKERTILSAEGAYRTGLYDSVQTISFLSPGEYDTLLSRNIVFLLLYDVSASNAIVECIVRGTPLLINPLEAAVEYLGESYPLYYRDLEEAAAKMMDRDLVLRAHEYLKRLPIQERLSGEGFLRTFMATSVYRSLSPPTDA